MKKIYIIYIYTRKCRILHNIPLTPRFTVLRKTWERLELIGRRSSLVQYKFGEVKRMINSYFCICSNQVGITNRTNLGPKEDHAQTDDGDSGGYLG